MAIIKLEDMAGELRGHFRLHTVPIFLKKFD